MTKMRLRRLIDTGLETTQASLWICSLAMWQAFRGNSEPLKSLPRNASAAADLVEDNMLSIAR